MVLTLYYVGFGAVPAAIALYYRLTIPETPRYTFDVARDIEKGKEDVVAYMHGKAGGTVDDASRVRGITTSSALKIPKASWRDFFSFYSKWRNGRVLLGTAGSWFVLDVAFYGLGLNSSTVLTAINYGTGPNVYTILYNLAAGNCILVCAGAIPGYWTTVMLVDIIGRKPIQLMGFIVLTILFIVWGFDFNNLSGGASLALYVLVQFFFNFGKLFPPSLHIFLYFSSSLSNPFYSNLRAHIGPNATTFIVPGECFPTRYRSTSHGLSAASGKTGSIIAQAAIAPLRTTGATKTNANPWQDHVMQIYSLFMFLGIFTTLLIPETKRLTLEKLSGEYDMSDEPVGGADVAVPKPGSEGGQEGVADGVAKADPNDKSS